MMGKLWWEESETAGHVMSSVSKQREMTTSLQLMVSPCAVYGMVPPSSRVGLPIKTNQIWTRPCWNTRGYSSG